MEVYSRYFAQADAAPRKCSFWIGFSSKLTGGTAGAAACLRGSRSFFSLRRTYFRRPTRGVIARDRYRIDSTRCIPLSLRQLLDHVLVRVGPPVAVELPDVAHLVDHR